MAADMRFLLVAAALFAIVARAKGADVANGKEMFRGCASCHNYDNDVRKSGPSLRTLFGKVMMRNGKRTTEENVRALILDGYNRMPSYRYQFRDSEFDDLIAFLKTLNARPGVQAKGDQAEDGKGLFTAYCARCHAPVSPTAQAGGSLQGLFQREKLADGKPITARNVLLLMEEGHGGAAGTKGWLNGEAAKALLEYLKTY
jgi:cytochrome c2